MFQLLMSIPTDPKSLPVHLTRPGPNATPCSVVSIKLSVGNVFRAFLLHAECQPRKQGVPVGEKAQDWQYPQGGRHSTQSAKTNTMTPPHSPRSIDSPGSSTGGSAERGDPNEWTKCCRVHSPGDASSTPDNFRNNYGRRFSGYTSPTLHNNSRPSVDSSRVGRGSGEVGGQDGGFDQCHSSASADQGSEAEDDEEAEERWSAQSREYTCAFDVDGFSSAEEETWRSDGEVRARVHSGVYVWGMHFGSQPRTEESVPSHDSFAVFGVVKIEKKILSSPSVFRQPRVLWGKA